MTPVDPLHANIYNVHKDIYQNDCSLLANLVQDSITSWTAWFTNSINLLLMVLEIRKVTIKAPSDSVSDEGRLLGALTAVLPPCLLIVKEKKGPNSDFYQHAKTIYHLFGAPALKSLQCASTYKFVINTNRRSKTFYPWPSRHYNALGGSPMSN